MKHLVIPMFAVAALAASAFAQTPSGGEINARRKVQQERVANGVKSGQLTAGETAKIEHGEAKVNREIRRDKIQNGGNLTNNEKRQVNRQQNGLSHEITADKNNAAKQHYGNNEVDRRRQSQQNRVAQGIASGKMSAGETAKVERKDAAINREVHHERAANGGNLTNNQKGQVNRQLNRTSKEIHKDKTN